MPVAARGFSLIETLIAMAIGAVLLLGAARFLPALQRQVLRQTQQQALENELWQRVYALAKHLQRAGYCAGQCHGQALVIADGGQCVIVRWDGNSNGIWELAPEADADSTGFRLRDGALETRRGVADCGGKNWEKMTAGRAVRGAGRTLGRHGAALLPRAGRGGQYAAGLFAGAAGGL